MHPGINAAIWAVLISGVAWAALNPPGPTAEPSPTEWTLQAKDHALGCPYCRPGPQPLPAVIDESYLRVSAAPDPRPSGD